MGLLDDAIREHLDLKRRRGGDPAEIERAEREALGPVRREPTVSAAFSEDGFSSSAVTDAPLSDFAFTADMGEFEGEASTSILPPEDDAALSYAEDEFEGAVADPPAGGSGLELGPTVAHDPDLEPLFEPVAEPEPKPKRRHLFGRHRHDADERSALPSELPADDPFDGEPEGTESASDGDAVGRAHLIAGNPELRSDGSLPPALRITPGSEPGNTTEYDVEQAFLDEDEPDPAAGEDILEETPDFLADTPDHDRLWFEQKPPPDFDFDN